MDKSISLPVNRWLRLPDNPVSNSYLRDKFLSHQVYPSLVAIAGILNGLYTRNTVGETKMLYRLLHFLDHLHGCEWSLVKK